MKSYRINSLHDIYLDDFIEGELENFNCYTMESIINAKNPKDAIKKYFEDILNYTFKIENADTQSKTILHYYNLVDDDNLEANEDEIKDWQRSRKKLYSNNTTLTIYELIQVEI